MLYPFACDQSNLIAKSLYCAREKHVRSISYGDTDARSIIEENWPELGTRVRRSQAEGLDCERRFRTDPLSSGPSLTIAGLPMELELCSALGKNVWDTAEIQVIKT